MPQRIQIKIAFLAFYCVRATLSAFFQNVHINGEFFWSHRSLFCRTRWPGCAENSNGTLQTEFSYCSSDYLEHKSSRRMCSPSIFKGRFQSSFKFDIFQQAYTLWEFSALQWIQLNWNELLLCVGQWAHQRLNPLTWHLVGQTHDHRGTVHYMGVTLALPGKYSCVWWQCGLVSDYFDHWLLMSLVSRQFIHWLLTNLMFWRQYKATMSSWRRLSYSDWSGQLVLILP